MPHIPDTTSALVLHSYNGVSALKLEQVPTPQPGPGEVLVRIAAAPINPSDLMFLEGKYGVHPELPHTAGFEGSGVVVAAGRGLYPQALLGRRVACTAPSGGTWAGYCVCSTNGVIPLLPSISLPQAAMLIVNPLTAYALVDIARDNGAKAIVQTAAASALGRMIVRLGQRFNMPVVNIVRRQGQVEQLQALGAEHILDSSRPDFDKQLKALCRELRATIAVDAVAGDMPGRLLGAMPRRSKVYVYGALAQAAIEVHPGDLIFRGGGVTGFYLGTWLQQQNPASILRAAFDVQRMLAKDLRSEVRACLPLDRFQQALDLYTNDMTGGKVLFVPNI